MQCSWSSLSRKTSPFLRDANDLCTKGRLCYQKSLNMSCWHQGCRNVARVLDYSRSVPGSRLAHVSWDIRACVSGKHNNSDDCSVFAYATATALILNSRFRFMGSAPVSTWYPRSSPPPKSSRFSGPSLHTYFRPPPTPTKKCRLLIICHKAHRRILLRTPMHWYLRTLPHWQRYSRMWRIGQMGRVTQYFQRILGTLYTLFPSPTRALTVLFSRNILSEVMSIWPTPSLRLELWHPSQPIGAPPRVDINIKASFSLTFSPWTTPLPNEAHICYIQS